MNALSGFINPKDSKNPNENRSSPAKGSESHSINSSDDSTNKPLAAKKFKKVLFVLYS